MQKICIFCTKKDKKQNGSKQKLVLVKTGDFEEKIKKYATALGDQALLSKLGSVDFAAKEMRYHGICRTKYQTAPEQVSKTSQKKRGSKEFNQSFAQRKRGSFLSLQINLLVVGGSGHYRYQCVGFKGRIQQLRFNP